VHPIDITERSHFMLATCASVLYNKVFVFEVWIGSYFRGRTNNEKWRRRLFVTDWYFNL